MFTKLTAHRQMIEAGAFAPLADAIGAGQDNLIASDIAGFSGAAALNYRSTTYNHHEIRTNEV